jgi:hypothetical protein
MLTWQSYEFHVLFWYPQFSRWCTLFRSSTSIKLVESEPDCFADRRIPSMCMAEVVLHFCSGFVFGQPCDTLCFLMHTGHHTNCSSSFTYVCYACVWSMLKGYVCVCICVHACACIRRLYALMNTLLWIPPLYFSFHRSYYYLNLGPLLIDPVYSLKYERYDILQISKFIFSTNIGECS